MKKTKITLAILTTLMLTTMLVGCGKDKKDDKKEDVAITIENQVAMASPVDMQLLYKEGYVISELTGEWIDESLDNQRPLSIMINNISEAMPQSGISQADVTYEMLVEGGITRFLCVFKDYSNSPKLGPVRSARLYYVKMAHMLDAYYGHVGWNSYAEQEINVLGVNNLNGLTALSNIMYYRDNSRFAPHNVYTDTDKIVAGLEYEEYRSTYGDMHEKMFTFNTKNTDLGSGAKASKVSIGFNSKPWFEYNAEDGLYYRFQYGGKQIDEQTNEQLSYKNVIVMFVQYTNIWDGLLDIDWNKGGTGYYATNGEYVPITWHKENGVVKYFDADGTTLKMNQGQTFVTVFDEDKLDGVVFE